MSHAYGLQSKIQKWHEGSTVRWSSLTFTHLNRETITKETASSNRCACIGGEWKPGNDPHLHLHVRRSANFLRLAQSTHHALWQSLSKREHRKGTVVYNNNNKISHKNCRKYLSDDIPVPSGNDEQTARQLCNRWQSIPWGWMGLLRNRSRSVCLGVEKSGSG